MATKKSTAKSNNKGIKMLEQKIAKLEAENKQLKESVKNENDKSSFGWLRKTGVVFFLTLSIVTFMLFNLASWTKNTLLDTDTFVATMQPVISEPAVQKVVQDEVTNKLFESVDIEAKLQETLPENIAFLSGPLSSQITSFTYNKVGTVLASPQIYNAWGDSLNVVHSRLIGYINNENADGVITVNDVYSTISQKVAEDSKIRFLFNKTLPEKFGSITLKEVTWLPEARAYVHALTITPPILLLVSLLSAVFALLLAHKKRIVLGTMVVLNIVLLLATLAALKITNWQIGQQVQAQYSEAAQEIYTTITTPLEARTLGYTMLLLAVFIVLLVSSKVSFIKKLRRFLDTHIQKISDSIFPKTSVPNWLVQASDKTTIISWTAFVLLFVVFGVRIPPSADQVVSGFIISTIVVFVLYCAHVIVSSLNRQK